MTGRIICRVAVVSLILLIAYTTIAFLNVQSQSAQETLLLSDNFENGVGHWVLNWGPGTSQMQLMTENGNTYLGGSGNVSPLINGIPVQDYTFKARFRISDGSIFFHPMYNHNTASSYSVYMDSSESIHLMKSPEHIELASASLMDNGIHLYEGWHTIQIGVHGSTVDAAVDGKALIRYTVNNPPPAGTSLWVQGGFSPASIAIDDVEFWGIPPATPTPEPTPSPTPTPVPQPVSPTPGPTPSPTPVPLTTNPGDTGGNPPLALGNLKINEDVSPGDVALPVAAVASGALLGGLASGVASGMAASAATASAGAAAGAGAGATAGSSSVLYKIWEFLFKGIINYIQGWYSRIERKIRKVSTVERVPFVLGLSSQEIAVGLISAVLVGVVFAYKDGLLFVIGSIIVYVLISGLAAVIHEIAHRYYAYRYQAVAEYKFWGVGTLTMLLTVLAFGVPFGQPARTLVEYGGETGKRKAGIIALAGPAVSLSLAIVFLLLLLYAGSFSTLWKSGFTMCMLACVYSLMPFEPMEGVKVLKWNKVAWGVAFLPALAFYLFMLIFVFTA